MKEEAKDAKAASASKVVLKFVGKGDAYMPSVPASDLTQEQVDSFIAWGVVKNVKDLVASGLYAPVGKETPAPEKAEKPAPGHGKGRE